MNAAENRGVKLAERERVFLQTDQFSAAAHDASQTQLSAGVTSPSCFNSYDVHYYIFLLRSFLSGAQTLQTHMLIIVNMIVSERQQWREGWRDGADKEVNVNSRALLD